MLSNISFVRNSSFPNVNIKIFTDIAYYKIINFIELFFVVLSVPYLVLAASDLLGSVLGGSKGTTILRETAHSAIRPRA